jgi:hypothetical protein
MQPSNGDAANDVKSARYGSTAHPGDSSWRPGEAPELELAVDGSPRQLTKPKFSILMPTLARPDVLPRAVRAVIDQDYEDWELLVKDGDGSAVVPEDPRISVIVGPDRNLTHAVNQLVVRATGDVLYWANDDDELLPGALHCVADTLGEAMWLRGLAEVTPADGSPTRVFGNELWDLREFARHNYLAEPAVFWRREAARAIGEFDEAVNLASDWDYFMRLGLRWEPRTVDRVLGRMNHHPGSLSIRQRELQDRHAEVIRTRYFGNELALRGEVAELHAEISRLHDVAGHTTQAYEASRSWRMTAPLRRIGDLARRRGKH